MVAARAQSTIAICVIYIRAGFGFVCYFVVVGSIRVLGLRMRIMYNTLAHTHVVGFKVLYNVQINYAEGG